MQRLAPCSEASPAFVGPAPNLRAGPVGGPRFLSTSVPSASL